MTTGTRDTPTPESTADAIAALFLDDAGARIQAVPGSMLHAWVAASPKDEAAVHAARHLTRSMRAECGYAVEPEPGDEIEPRLRAAGIEPPPARSTAEFIQGLVGIALIAAAAFGLGLWIGLQR